MWERPSDPGEDPFFVKPDRRVVHLGTDTRKTNLRYRPPRRYECKGTSLILVRSLRSSIHFDPNVSILAVIMTTQGYNLLSHVPMERLASSSSLPPERKTPLDEFGNKFWQFDAATIANVLSPFVAPLSTLVVAAYSMLDQGLPGWRKDTE